LPSIAYRVKCNKPHPELSPENKINEIIIILIYLSTVPYGSGSLVDASLKHEIQTVWQGFDYST